MVFELLNINDFSQKDFDFCLSLMENGRKEYINSLKHQKGKALSVAAEWLTKKTAAKLLKKPIEEIIILRDEKGKPFIENNLLFFSISHSGDYAAVIFDSQPIGLDIEVLRQIDVRLKKRICTDSDLLFLKDGKSAEEENLRLLKIWTAKEGYFKKTGSGITDFKSISYKDLNCTHSFEKSLIITVVK